MILGFRAGADPSIGVAANDFVGTRRAWGLPADFAPIGRMFPLSGGAAVTPAMKPVEVVKKLDEMAGPVLAAGMWPYLSLKPDVAETLNGTLDVHITAMGRWCRDVGVPVYFSVHHEPENDPMGAPAGDFYRRARNFVSVHTRCYRIMKSIALDGLRMGPCHMVYQWSHGRPETADGEVMEGWRVPAEMRDFVALDSYTSNWSWRSSGTTLASKPDFQRALMGLGLRGPEIVLAERGISRTARLAGANPEQVQASILREDYDWLVRAGAHALLYWNSGGGTDDSEFRLGAPGRKVFTEIALDAATTPEPEPDDRYQEGYAAGVTDGVAQGRRAAFAESLDHMVGALNTLRVKAASE